MIPNLMDPLVHTLNQSLSGHGISNIGGEIFMFSSQPQIDYTLLEFEVPGRFNSFSEFLWDLLIWPSAGASAADNVVNESNKF